MFDLAPIQAQADRSEGETSEHDRYVVITVDRRTVDRVAYPASSPDSDHSHQVANEPRDSVDRVCTFVVGLREQPT